jgi:heat-inducible transcriptional repressor
MKKNQSSDVPKNTNGRLFGQSVNCAAFRLWHICLQNTRAWLQYPMVKRQEQLLEMVIERFIVQKRPVPSGAFANPLGVSSATVRHDLAALEEMGLLRQPHTSAGRMPTREGWRLYASKYIPPKPLPQASLLHLETALGSVDGEQRLRLAMQLTAGLSGYAAVLSFAPKEARLEKLLLSDLEQGRILAVLLLEG